MQNAAHQTAKPEKNNIGTAKEKKNQRPPLRKCTCMQLTRLPFCTPKDCSALSLAIKGADLRPVKARTGDDSEVATRGTAAANAAGATTCEAEAMEAMSML
jgi:hypothetical protein